MLVNPPCRKTCKTASLLLLFRPHHHHHLPTFHFRHGFDIGELFEIIADPFEQAVTELLVRHFAAPESQCYLALVALFEEARQISQLDLVITLFSPRPELHLFDLNDLLLGPRLVGTLLLLVLVFAKVHEPAHRRISLGGNFDKIDFRFFSLDDRVSQTHDAKRFVFYAGQPYLRGRYFPIDAKIA